MIDVVRALTDLQQEKGDCFTALQQEKRRLLDNKKKGDCFTTRKRRLIYKRKKGAKVRVE